MDWHIAAIMCEELYDGTLVNLKEGFFVCPECGEPIFEEDWRDHDDWEVCPICGFEFMDYREDSAE